MNAREAALRALGAFRRGQQPESTIDALGLDPREASLARRICACVLTNSIFLDWWLGLYLTRPADKLHPVMLDALRLSAAQIAYFDRIPASAAVDEGVRLVKSYVNKAASGMANAVLRKIAADGQPPKPEGMSGLDRMSIEFSCPKELAEYYVNEYGIEAAEEVLRAQNEVPPVYARTNTLKTTDAGLLEALAEEGVSAEVHPWLPGTVILADAGSLERLGAFRNGLFFVQDPAATLAVLAADLTPGMRVLDACASPGGKSFAAAMALRGEGSITSRDVSEKKLLPIRESAERLGVDIIHAEARDAAREAPGEGFDAVLCDAPCSGYGTVRKKPEIRYKSLGSVAALPEKQLAILRNLAGAVKPGGVLLYSTCTLIGAENAGVTDTFLAENREFTMEPFELPGAGECPGRVTLLPGRLGTDGFYICRMRRKRI